MLPMGSVGMAMFVIDLNWSIAAAQEVLAAAATS
jgi:hypothetical protein